MPKSSGQSAQNNNSGTPARRLRFFSTPLSGEGGALSTASVANVSDAGATEAETISSDGNTRLRKFYEREPVPPPTPAPTEPALSSVSPETLEAGSWSATPKVVVKGGGLAKKVRVRQSFNVYANRKDAETLSAFAEELGISFSEWARRVLLREIAHARKTRERVEG